MRTYKRSEFIDLQPQTVFDFVTNQEKIPAWSPEVVKSEVATEGPLKPGSKLRQIRKRGQKEMRTVVEVIAHEPPKTHAVKARILGVDSTFAFSFNQENGGTRVQFEAKIIGRGFGKLFERPLARMMENADDKLLERLKSAIGKELTSK